MASESELTGHGVPAQLAHSLGGEPSALTCTGTDQAHAATVKSKNTELVTASSQTGAILPSGELYAFFAFHATNSDSAVVYPPVGDYLNDVQNQGLTIAQHKGAIVWQYKKGYWTSILTA